MTLDVNSFEQGMKKSAKTPTTEGLVNHRD